MGLLTTPQSFQKCIDDKISNSAPVARDMCRWTCARCRVREDVQGTNNNGVSIRKKSFAAPATRVVGEAGSQCACRNA
jgi:hypothetical protein